MCNSYMSDVSAAFTQTSANVKLVCLVNKVRERHASSHPRRKVINWQHLLKKESELHVFHTKEAEMSLFTTQSFRFNKKHCVPQF